MAAAMLLFDMAGRVLLVKPVYKDYWDAPGGVVERNESPREAAHREVREELGLDRVPGALLCVDWVPPRPERSEGLITVFDGGLLQQEEIDGIRLERRELAAFDFVDIVTAEKLLSPLLCRRLSACLAAHAEGRSAYLENGVPI
jgi:8-oxo-dGTP pyrophosphatase MutT (NUDIX family)